VNERAIIETIGQVLGERTDLSDDAYYNPDNREIATCDMLIEGTHFDLGYTSAEDLGWKAAAVNISDIAATGGALDSLLVSVGLPENCAKPAFIRDLYEGLASAAETYHGKIIGGDTVRSKQFTINVTALGHLPEGHTAGRRDQAKPGDVIVTTGFHGCSAAGFHLLKEHHKRNPDKPFSSKRDEQLTLAHLRPQPRIDEGLILSKRFDRYALMDTSDGLADGLLKIAHASRMKLIVDRSRLPMLPDLHAYATLHNEDPYHWVLYGGEDFELLATVPAKSLLTDPLSGQFSIIGYVDALKEKEQPGAYFQARADDVLMPLSYDQTYQHF